MRHIPLYREKLSELREIIDSKMHSIEESFPYLAEETKPIEPSSSLSRLRQVPEAVVCVSCSSCSTR